MEPGETYAGKPVLITGHTGFKGTWLGMAADAPAPSHRLRPGPPTDPEPLRSRAWPEHRLHVRRCPRSRTADRRLSTASSRRSIFHLAGAVDRPAGYEDPLETFATNVMGTVNVLEARGPDAVRASVVVVTSDKCLQQSRVGTGVTARRIRWAAATPTARARAAPSSSATYRESYFLPETACRGRLRPRRQRDRRRRLGARPHGARLLSALRPTSPSSCGIRERSAPGSMFSSRCAAISRSPNCCRGRARCGRLELRADRAGCRSAGQLGRRAVRRRVGLRLLDDPAVDRGPAPRGPAPAASTAPRPTSSSPGLRCGMPGRRFIGRPPGTASTTEAPTAARELVEHDLHAYQADARAAGLAWAIDEEPGSPT